MKIVNIIATATLNKPLDLSLVHSRIPQTEMSSRSWLKFRLRPDNTYIAFYRSGKFLITTKELSKIDVIADNVVKLLKKSKFNVKLVKVEVHNIVVQTKIPLQRSLEEIVVNLDSKKASFEPEQFPALIYKDWGVGILLFSTGNCIIAGLKKIEDAPAIIENLNLLSV